MATRTKPRTQRRRHTTITLKGCKATTRIREGERVEVSISEVPPAALQKDAALRGRALIKAIEGEPDERVDFSLLVSEAGEIILTAVWPADLATIAAAIQTALREAKQQGIFTFADVYGGEEPITTTAFRGYVKPGSVDVYLKPEVHHA
jgi:hypothetical protein